VEVGYPLVAVLAFTPYAALTSPLPVVAALVLRRRAVAAAAGVAALALGLAVVPRAVAGPRPQADGPRLVVMTANLWLGRADAQAVMRVARAHHVDVLSVQELRPELLARLDAAGAVTYFPSRATDPREGASGSGLLARRTLHPTGAPDGAAHAQPEAALEIPGAPAVTIKAVHPAPPVRPSADAAWKRAIAALPGSDSRGDVRILAGDLNATLDHPELRALLDRGYVDAADAVGQGLRPTWPALPRRALPITLDHVLVDRRVRVETVTIVRIPRTDHRAVIAVLRLPKGP